MLHDLLNSALQGPAKSSPTASLTGKPTCALVEENPKKFILVYSLCDGEEPKTERKHIWPVVCIDFFFIKTCNNILLLPSPVFETKVSLSFWKSHVKSHIKSEFKSEPAPASFISWAFNHSMKKRDLRSCNKSNLNYFTELSALTKIKLTVGGNVVREGWMENFRPVVPWAASSDTHIEDLEAETFHQVTGLPFCWGCLLKKGTSGHRPVLLLSSLIITLRLGVQQARSMLPGPRSISRRKGNKSPFPFPSW